jgi:diguanylate cyclase (GGDEF)-like protein
LSFRSRLTLFFALIVVLPMIAVVVLVAQVTQDSRTGKADSRLAAGLETALSVYSDDLDAAETATRGLASSPALAAALRTGDRQRVEPVARTLARQNDIDSLVIRDARGRQLAVVGPPAELATFRAPVREGDHLLATITASTTNPSAYLSEVSRLTNRDAAIVDEHGPVSATLALDGTALPPAGRSNDVEVAGEKLRAATADLRGSGGLRVALFTTVESAGFFASSPLIVGAAVVFFAIAVLFVAFLLRALGSQVATMLDAARRVGSGDFSQKVPVIGSDEIAGLASEFNKMSDRLGEQMEELRHQRVEIERSVQRIGEAFASGLDRSALLEIVAETALSACGADYAVLALMGQDATEVSVGDSRERLEDAVLAAEARATSDDQLVEESSGGAVALASPLRRIGEGAERLGIMTIARVGEPFDPGERDIFLYLVGQASASIENVALHELAAEQAVTDELTGLSNKRRFSEMLQKEFARAQRFGHNLSLLMLDIDDFKQVNDVHGHLQGDEVLRAIGRALDSESRGVDEPARYGGEEFAVALPETGTDGALEVAERIRARIESQRVPRGDGDGHLNVTASIGVASLSEAVTDPEGLIAAADKALYVAKAAGKYRVEAEVRPKATASTARKQPAKKRAPAKRARTKR